MSTVIAAKKIEVPDAPEVKAVDLALQILENISAQVKVIDVELFSVAVAEKCPYPEVSNLEKAPQ